jgi:leucyl/phenylalanyl-tRNA---protein transferase
MPIFELDFEDDNWFPSPELANKSGILAIGGDLSVGRLVKAYQSGIFPWYNPDEPIIWWSPDPRMVLFPSKVNISASMRQVLRREVFTFTVNESFAEVIRNCQLITREGQGGGTWIGEEMIDAYCNLHEAGYAHSVEVRQGGQLVGGLYGLALGRCFFGESMFSKVSNASKAALIMLAKNLEKNNFELIDCQVETPHLGSLGAELIRRKEFLRLLALHSDSRTTDLAAVFEKK